MAEIVGSYMEEENIKFIKKHVPTKASNLFTYLNEITIPGMSNVVTSKSLFCKIVYNYSLNASLDKPHPCIRSAF